MNKKYVKHIIKEGSRQHVISYLGVQGYDSKIKSVQHCNCPECEVNKEYDDINQQARGNEE